MAITLHGLRFRWQGGAAGANGLLARARALEPRLLLLDEPAAGMNTSKKAALSQLIREIRQRFGLTVILIEHHVPLVMGLCDRIAVLNFGQLIALDTPEAVRQDPAVVAAYLGAVGELWRNSSASAD